jgi:hypothetical protein
MPTDRKLRPAQAALPPASTAPEPDEAEVTIDPAPAPVVDHPRRWEVLSPPFDVPPAEPASEPPRPVRYRTAGSLALAVDCVETMDGVALAVAPISPPALPTNDQAPWQDHLWWSSGFLTCRTHEERLSRLQRWVEAAGGQLVTLDGCLMAQLPRLAPSLGRNDLIRRCRELGVSVREACR